MDRMEEVANEDYRGREWNEKKSKAEGRKLKDQYFKDFKGNRELPPKNRLLRYLNR